MEVTVMEQNEHSKYEDPKKRAEIGKMSGLIGIACNFLRPEAKDRSRKFCWFHIDCSGWT